jgi:hypothetical protein
MGTEEDQGLVSQFFGWVKRVICTVICAWYEILILVVIFVSFAALTVLFFYLFFIGDAFIALFTGPIAIVVGIILFVIWLVMVLVFIYILVQVGKWTEKKVLRCWQDCK